MPKIFNFFKSRQKSLKEIKHRQTLVRRKLEREVCALVSSGNVSLQQGEYITQEDMDILQHELETYFSSDQSKW